jgi:hypothetical protein
MVEEDPAIFLFGLISSLTKILPLALLHPSFQRACVDA